MFTVDKGCFINTETLSGNWFQLADVDTFAENIWVVTFFVVSKIFILKYIITEKLKYHQSNYMLRTESLLVLKTAVENIE